MAVAPHDPHEREHRLDERSHQDRQARILAAVLRLLSQHGISDIQVLNHYYGDKAGLIRAAPHRIEAQDVALAGRPRALPDVPKFLRAGCPL